MEDDIMAKAYDAGEYGHLVHYDQGFYQMNTEAEDEDWTEVLGTADKVESLGPLLGWGDWDNDSQTVRLDDADAEGLAVVYDTQGRRVVE